MPYLNLDTNYFDHPKTRRLVGILGPMADVLPLRLWAYCAKIHPADGAMKGYSDEEIHGVLGSDNDVRNSPSGSFTVTEALVRVGFLKRMKNGCSCVDWGQHQGHLEAFSRRGKEAAKARWSKYATSNAKASPSNTKSVTSNAPTIPTIPSQPNQPNQLTDKPVRAVFVPPSIDEIRAYFIERKTAIDPEQFLAHYESRGWMVKGSRIKSWKACLTTWEKNDNGNAAGGGPRTGRIVGAAAPVPGKYDHLG